MKRLFLSLLAVCALSMALYGQTAQEIVAKMDAVMSSNKGNDNFYMVMEIKMPIVGTAVSKVYSLGDNSRMDMEMGKERSIMWEDATTSWDYDVSKNQITIKQRDLSKSSDADENMGLFDSVTEGYDVSIKKETPTEWHIRCKKNRNNKEKDDPKNMDLVVSKATYMPIGLSAKTSFVTVTMRDLSFGTVTEADVTFDPAKYAGIPVVDQR